MEIISLMYYANEMWPVLPSFYAHLLNTIALTLIHSVTRMFSSGMRTACLLTVSQHTLGGVSGPGGCLPRGCLPLVRGVSTSGPWGCLSLVPGGVSQHTMGQTSPPWTDRHL